MTTRQQKGPEQAVFCARLDDAWQTCRCESTLLVRIRREMKAPAFAGLFWLSLNSKCTYRDAH